MYANCRCIPQFKAPHITRSCGLKGIDLYVPYKQKMRPVYPFGFRDVKKATYYFDIGTFYYPITPEKSCNNEMVKSSFFKKSFFAPCFKFRWEWSNGDFKN